MPTRHPLAVAHLDESSARDSSRRWPPCSAPVRYETLSASHTSAESELANRSMQANVRRCPRLPR